MELGGSQLFLIKMILGHGIDIEELASIQNAVEKREGFSGKIWLSISHTEKYVTASVILEGNHEN